MNILYICPDDPRLVDNGSRQRTNSLWRALGNVGNVYALRPKFGNVEEAVDADSAIALVRAWPANPLARLMQRVFVKLFKPAVWPVYPKSYSLGKVPKEWRDVKFDVVVARYIWTASIIGAWQIAPCYIDIDDAPLQVYGTILARGTPPGLRWMKRKAIELYQRYVLSRCKAAWLPDASQAGEFGGIVKCGELMNIARSPRHGFQLSANASERRYLMSVGLLDYAPNVEGIDWFIEIAWPLVRSKWPDMEYLVCGGKLDAKTRRKWSSVPGVRVLGFVDDIDAIYQKSIAVVAPIMKGAGTCIKVIEACMRGRKVIATKFAVRGISPTDAESLGIELFANGQEFVDVLDAWAGKADADLLALQEQTRQYAERLWSFDQFANCVRQTLERDY